MTAKGILTSTVLDKATTVTVDPASHQGTLTPLKKTADGKLRSIKGLGGMLTITLSLSALSTKKPRRCCCSISTSPLHTCSSLRRPLCANRQKGTLNAVHERGITCTLSGKPGCELLSYLLFHPFFPTRRALWMFWRIDLRPASLALLVT